jgi:hypothetical protein
MNYRALMSSQPQNISSICNVGNTNFCTLNGSINLAGAVRVDLRLLGPADTSGAYQEWLDAVSQPDFKDATPFEVRTPDKRIQSPTQALTGALPKPVYFKYTPLPPPDAIMPPERGKYYWSNYWSSSRALNNHSQFPRDGGGRTRRNNDFILIQDAMMLPVEMDLLLAEAEIRLGTPANAVPLINNSRVANGELPPVTVAGVPESNACVPKRWDGSCGDLMDALMYEKRIETYGTAISFFDLRGWGCLAEGTLLHLPPPGRQLDLLGKPIYSYGGSGPFSAPKPTNCPLLHKP